MRTTCPRGGPSITAITPDVAIEWGFNPYLADCSPGQSEAYRSSRRALDDFEQLIERHSAHPREHLYLVKLRMAATSFARGIARRKESLARHTEAIAEEKARMIARIAQTERLGGILRGALQLLMLGGFSYALTRTLLAVSAVELDPALLTPEYASLATALGSALVGSFCKAWFMNHRILRVFRRYEEELDEADREYTRSVIREYELAAQFAYNAWTQLTGEEPPVTEAFRRLLMSVMGKHRVEEPPGAPVARLREDVMGGLA